MPVCALYSNENKDRNGTGCIIKYISVKDIKEGTSLEDIKKKLRSDQKIENEKYLYHKSREDVNDTKKETNKPTISYVYNEKQPIDEEDKLNDLIPLEMISPEDIDFINMDSQKDHSGDSILLIGSSKSGKSTVIMSLFRKYFNKKKYISTLFSVNSHIPIYKNSGDLIKVNKFVTESEKIIKDMKKINMESEPVNKWRYCILLDDIVEARYSRVLNNLLLTYRNSNFSSIISIQYAKLISKAARCSANNLLFFFQNLQEGIESVLRSFLGAEFSKLGVTKLTDQISLYRLLTRDHAFIYYHPMSGTLRRIKLKI